MCQAAGGLYHFFIPVRSWEGSLGGGSVLRGAEGVRECALSVQLSSTSLVSLFS